MAEKSEKKINIYKVAGKVGKSVRKSGGYVLAVAGTWLITKGPEIIKKIKR